MNRRTEVQRCRSPQRRGFLAVCVLACLAIAATTMAITVRCTLQARRNTRLEHQMLQTEWLLDAGVHRALRSAARSR